MMTALLIFPLFAVAWMLFCDRMGWIEDEQEIDK